MPPTIYDRLKEPFPPSDLEWRVQSQGSNNGKPWARIVPYIDARAVMDRLDDVVGPDNWQVAYQPIEGGYTEQPMQDGRADRPGTVRRTLADAGFVCTLSLRIDGEWVSKADAADRTDIEGIKGGVSGALKRAAVLWGIGRYLYRLPTAWAEFHEGGSLATYIDRTKYKFDPPQLPPWALPSPEPRQEATPPPRTTPNPSGNGTAHKPAVDPLKEEQLPKLCDLAKRTGWAWIGERVHELAYPYSSSRELIDRSTGYEIRKLLEHIADTQFVHDV